jgi:hypothetical protein
VVASSPANALVNSRAGNSSNVISAATPCNTSVDDSRDPYVMDFTCRYPSNWDFAGGSSSSTGSGATHSTGENYTVDIVHRLGQRLCGLCARGMCICLYGRSRLLHNLVYDVPVLMLRDLYAWCVACL